MSYTVIAHDQEPVIVIRLHKDYVATQEMHDSNSALLKLLDQATQKQNVIIVYDGYEPSFTDLQQGSNSVSQGEDPLFKHVNLKRVVLVSTSEVVKLMAAGMGTDAFGNLNIPVFEDEIEALAHCRLLAI